MADLKGAIKRIRQQARIVRPIVPPRLGATFEYEAVPLSVVEHELALVTHGDKSAPTTSSAEPTKEKP